MKSILIPLIILSLIFTIFFSIQPPIKVLNQINDIKPDFSFDNVTFSFIKRGQKKWVISSTDAQLYKTTNTIFFNNINGQLFSQQSPDDFFKFESNFGTFKMNSEVLSMAKTSSEIHLNHMSYFITCDEFKLNAKTQSIEAHGNIQINSESLTAQSRRLTADLINNEIKLSYNVHGSIFSK